MQFRVPSYSCAILILPMLFFCESRAQNAPLDTTTFVVMGEGLAAGMADYGLSSIVQSHSFPAVMAAQMQTAFPQPLIQPPGIGDVIGYPGQEVRLPVYPQGTVRVFPAQPNPGNDAPTLFVLNLSVPAFTLADSVSLRPATPIVQRDMKQTLTNMILGFPQLFLQRPVPLWTQFEYAKAMLPTLALIELGFYEALDAAVYGDPAKIPDAAAFGATYRTMLAGLRGLQSQVIATTIPSPFDTAYFSSPVAAASLLATSPELLAVEYGLAPGDLITRNALTTIGVQHLNGAISPLPEGSIIIPDTAAEITRRIDLLNAQIVSAAKAHGAVLYDLNAFLHRVRVLGASTNSRTLTANYLGGFYSLDGVYPGPTGHALIANDILAFLNRTYGRAFPLVNIDAVAAADPTTHQAGTPGPRRSAVPITTEHKGGR